MERQSLIRSKERRYLKKTDKKLKRKEKRRRKEMKKKAEIAMITNPDGTLNRNAKMLLSLEKAGL